jgi:MFS family permease
MGAYSTMFSLAMVVGPWAGTAALDRFGSFAAWTAVFVCGLVAAFVIALTVERTQGTAANSLPEGRVPVDSDSAAALAE